MFRVHDQVFLVLSAIYVFRCLGATSLSLSDFDARDLIPEKGLVPDMNPSFRNSCTSCEYPSSKCIVLCSLGSAECISVYKLVRAAFGNENIVVFETTNSTVGECLYRNNMQKACLAVSPPLKQAQSCLLSDIPKREFEECDMPSISAKSVTDCINKHCGTHRLPSGRLTRKGLALEEMYSAFFDPESEGGCSVIESLPTRDEFTRDFCVALASGRVQGRPPDASLAHAGSFGRHTPRALRQPHGSCEIGRARIGRSGRVRGRGRCGTM
eukprot:852923_1